MSDEKRVDVLAVMDEFVAVVGDEFGNDPALRLRAARAAVAELIEAAQILDAKGFFDDVPYSPDADLVRVKEALANLGAKP